MTNNIPDYSGVPFRCHSPQCQAQGRQDVNFYLLKREPGPDEPPNECPTCGSGRYLVKVDVIHLLIHDPLGKIRGSDSSPFRLTTANFWSPACDRGKKLVESGSWGSKFRMTTLPEAATCLDCRNVAETFRHQGVVEHGLYVPGMIDERE